MHYLSHVHSHITRAVAAIDTCFASCLGLTSMAQPSVSYQGKPAYKRPFPAEVSPLSASSTKQMWELLAGNRTAVLPRHARGRQIMGLVYVCSLL